MEKNNKKKKVENDFAGCGSSHSCDCICTKKKKAALNRYRK